MYLLLGLSLQKQITMKYKLPKDYELMLMMAFRYALGRRTYVVPFIVDNLLDNWEVFSEERKKQFKREINEHKEMFGNLGHEMDEAQWNKILNK